jgi:hypothetical protein
MSQAPLTDVSTSATTPPSARDAQADAHLAQLHKMSTTAGVTNLDYVAVNQTAIVAVLLGLASALAFFGYLLLIIPIVGVIFAVVAIRQINDSSGTQTGRGLALLGLALCVLLGGAAVAKEGIAIARVKGDENRIAATLNQYGAAVRDAKYKEAYDLCDDDFQNNVSYDHFKKSWEQMLANSPLGKLEVMEWNGVSPIFESAAGSRLAGTKIRMKFAKGNDERFDVTLRQVGDKWLVYRMPDFFVPEKKPTPSKKGEDVFNF